MDQLRTFMFRIWWDHVHSCYGVDVSAYIHGTELIRFGMQLVWFRIVTLSGFWCLYTVYCKVGFIWRILFIFWTWQRVDRVLGIFSGCPNWDSPATSTAEECVPPSFGSGGGGAHLLAGEGVTLESRCNPVKWPFGVKKISIKWLLPVKMTLKVIKQCLKVFCWSCDLVSLLDEI